jgi:hypothetical protein
MGLTSLSRVTPFRLCFGKVVEGGVDKKGRMYLDTRWPTKATAARVAHLYQHLRWPIRFRPARPCRLQVDQAMRQEASAIALELTVRKKLNVSHSALRYPFEPAFHKQTVPLRLDWLYKRISDPKRGLPYLKLTYLRRCIRTKKTKKDR